MGTQRKVTRLVAVVAAALVLVVLGIRFVAVPAFENSPDHVHIVVTSVRSLASGTPLRMIFDHQVAQQANAIYQQLTAGTDVTDKAISCPAAPLSLAYNRYVLTFSRSGTTVATATDDALGCGEFTVERLDGSTAYLMWTGDHERCFGDYLHTSGSMPPSRSISTRARSVAPKAHLALRQVVPGLSTRRSSDPNGISVRTTNSARYCT